MTFVGEPAEIHDNSDALVAGVDSASDGTKLTLLALLHFCLRAQTWMNYQQGKGCSLNPIVEEIAKLDIELAFIKIAGPAGFMGYEDLWGFESVSLRNESLSLLTYRKCVA